MKELRGQDYGKVGLEMIKAFTKLKLVLKRETMGFKLRSRRFQKKKKDSQLGK